MLDEEKACLCGFLFLFCFYLSLLSPYIGYGDAGSLALSSFYLTGAHPPGYAGTVILQKLFAFLPAGSYAFRFHVSAAFFYALSSACLLKLIGDLNASCSKLSFFLALSPYLFPALVRTVLQVEVYGFFFFLITALLNALTRKEVQASFALFFLFGFFFHPYFFLILALPFFSLWLRRKRVVICAFFFLLGLSHVVFYPLRNFYDPTQRFALSRKYPLVKYLSAEGYQELSLPRFSEGRKLLPVLFPLSSFLLLFPFLFQKTPFPEGLGLVLLPLLLSFPAFLSFDLVPYLFPSVLGLIVLACVSEKLRSSFFHRFLATAFLLAVGIQLGTALKQGFFADQAFLAAYRESLYRSLPEGAWLILPNRSTFYSFSFLYDAYVEKRRKDLKLFYPIYAINPEAVKDVKEIHAAMALDRLYSSDAEQILFPRGFFAYVFQQSAFLSLANALTLGRVKEEMINHQRNFWLAEKLAQARSPVFFANREIEPFPLFFCHGLFYRKRCQSQRMLKLLLNPPNQVNSLFLSAHLLGQIQSQAPPIPGKLKTHPEYQLMQKGKGYSITDMWLKKFKEDRP